MMMGVGGDSWRAGAGGWVGSRALLPGWLGLLAVLVACGSGPTVDSTAGSLTPETVTTTEPVELIEPTPVPTIEPTIEPTVAVSVPTPTAVPTPSDSAGPAAASTVTPPPIGLPTFEQPTVAPAPVLTLAEAQRAELVEQRARWEASRPAAYNFVYDIQCDCPLSFWDIRVGEDGSVELAESAAGLDPPFATIDEIFDHIEQSLEQGTPLLVEYGLNIAGPWRYSQGEKPFLGDGEFSFTISRWTHMRTATEVAEQRAAFTNARQLWSTQTLAQDYDYTFARPCFCDPFSTGPYAASVRSGLVSAATYTGNFDPGDDFPDMEPSVDNVFTIPEVFDEIALAIEDAHTVEVEYHPTLGYPTSVSIDWVAWLVDDEVGYQLDDVRSPDA